MVRLQDKTAIVTGGARGIGQAIAASLAREGCDILVGDVRSAQDTIETITGLGRKAVEVRVDVSKSREVNEMVNKALAEFGSIDILVNNAGISPLKGAVEMTDEEWHKMIDTNLSSAFYCCRAVLPSMIKRQSGRIINNASIAGAAFAFPQGSHYAAAKAGMVGFTRSLAKEVAQYGITVNAVGPGVIETELSRAGTGLATCARYIPMGRLGLPEDVAPVVVFLASDEARWITGQIIFVDGGTTLGTWA